MSAATCSECPKLLPAGRKWTCGGACWKARTERLGAEPKVPLPEPVAPPVTPPKPRKIPPVYRALAEQVAAHRPLIDCGIVWAPQSELDALGRQLLGGLSATEAATAPAGR